MKSINRKMWKSLCGALLAAAMAVPGVSSATSFTDLASWQLAVGTYSDVDLSSYVGGTVTAGTGIDLAGQSSLSYGADLTGVTVGAGWATWAGGRTPDVLYTLGTSITGTFAPGVSSFGLAMEPNTFAVFTMDLLLSDGTLISQLVDGFAGAKFFGWSGQSITSMTITCAGCGGFAMGEMVIGAPESASLALLSIGLLTLGAGAARRRNKRA